MTRRWMAHAVAVGVVVVLCRLGLWQLDRAAYKHGIEADIRASQTEPPLALADADHLIPWHRYTSESLHLEPSRPIYLLENRVLNGVNGYDAFSVIATHGKPYLIGLGWLPAPQSRDQVPELNPVDLDSLTLYSLPLPETGLDLAAGVAPEQVAPKVYRIQSLAAVLPDDRPAQPLVLMAESPMLKGALYHAPEIRFTEQKHRAYATQWFVMAAVFTFLYYRLQRRPSTRSTSRET